MVTPRRDLCRILVRLTFLPLAAIPSASADPHAILYILATAVAFGLPAICCGWQRPLALASARRNDKAASCRLLTLMFIAMQLCVILFVFVNLSRFCDRRIHQKPHAYGRRVHGRSIYGVIHANVFSQSGIVLNYIAVALGGIVVAGQENRYRSCAIFVFAFLPSILYMMAYADKGTLFQSAAYFLGGVLVSRVARGDRSLIDKQTVKIAALAFILVAPLLNLLLLARVGKYGDGMFYLRSYAFGHLYGFSDWFSNYISGWSVYADPDSPTWGFWTFLAIGRHVMPDTFIPPGYFTEYFEIPGVLRTNIYTMFRGLIYDFGLIGSLVFMALFGLVASLSYNSMLRKPAPVLGQSLFILTTGFIYSSYMFSLFAWNSVYAAFIGVTLLLAVNRVVGARLRQSASLSIDAADSDDAKPVSVTPEWQSQRRRHEEA